MHDPNFNDAMPINQKHDHASNGGFCIEKNLYLYFKMTAVKNLYQIYL